MASPTNGSIGDGLTDGTIGNGMTNGMTHVETVNDFGPHINLVSWSQVVLAMVFLGLRIYCKLLKHRGLWWDDHMLIIAALTLVCAGAINLESVSLGLGKHVFDVKPDNIPTIDLLNLFLATTTILAVMSSKTSFGMTLLRITTGASKSAVWFLILTMNLALAGGVLLSWLRCSPIQKSWISTTEGTCRDLRISVYYRVASAAYSGFCDIALVGVSWTVVWSLQMKKQEKVGIVIAMSMGIFAGVAAFIRAAYLPQLLDEDFTFVGHELILWGNAEVAITIMAASIPVLRVLLREVKTVTRRKYNTSFGTRNMDFTDMYHTSSSEMGPVSRVNTTIKSDYKGGDGGETDLGTAGLSGGSRFVRKLSSPWGPGGSPSGDLGDGRILQTQEVTIRYQERNDMRAGGSVV